jgi:hypothetical protein
MGMIAYDCPSQILSGNPFCGCDVCDDTGDSMDGEEGVNRETSHAYTESAQLH